MNGKPVLALNPFPSDELQPEIDSSDLNQSSQQDVLIARPDEQLLVFGSKTYTVGVRGLSSLQHEVRPKHNMHLSLFYELQTPGT